MTDGAGGGTPVTHRDRTTGLVIFGIGFLVVAALLGLMAAVVGVALAMPQPSGAPVLPGWMRVTLPVGYLAFAAALATLGIGCCLRHRWARALALILGWLWLGTGVVECVFLPVVMLLPVAGTEQPMPAGVLLAITLVVVVGVLIVPGLALVLFFRSPHVKATCEARHPTPSWTDRCPLPVLGFALLQAFGGLVALALAPFFPVPWVGSVLTGPVAMLLLAAFALGWLALAWQNYRLRAAGWWGTLALVIVGSAWGLVMMCDGGLAAYYEALGLTDPAFMTTEASLSGPLMIGIQVVLLALWIGYLLWVRRFYPAFRRQDSTS